MWFEFFLTAAFVFLVLVVPGYCFLRALDVERVWSLCGASLFSPFFIALAGIFYSLIGVRSSWYLVLLFSGLICLVAFVLRLMFRDTKGVGFSFETLHFSGKKWMPLLYVIAGFILGIYVFVWSLDTPLSFSQNFDNGFHLNAIRAFFESGDWSILNSSKYRIGIDRELSPFGSVGGFYPAAFHLVCVMAMDALGVATTMAENAALFIFSSIMFPLSMLLLLDTLFNGETRALSLGSVATLSFAAFPWGLIVWGPVYPNMAAYAVFPAAFLLGMKAVDSIAEKRIDLALFSIFVIGVFSLVVLQPNAFFFGFICLSIYICHIVFNYNKENTSLRIRFMRLFAIAIVAVFLWTMLYIAPPFQGVLSENWASTLSKKRALLNVFTVSLTQYPAQLPLAVLIAFGVFSAATKKGARWLIAIYALFCFMYFLDMSTEGFLKNYLTGFWYTDYNRIAACVAILAIPLVVLGLDFITESFCSGIQRKGSTLLALLLVVASFVFINYLPNISFGADKVLTTPFGTTKEYLEDLNTKAKRNQYGQDEIDFVDKVLNTIPEGSLVLNVPDDGSVFAYGINGLRTYYRDYRTYVNAAHTNRSPESERSVLIREHIDEVATNREVQDALRENDCHYLLLLDRTHSMSTQVHLFSYNEELWSHFQMIDDGTPGFEIVLQEGDMRLYRIEYPD